MLTIEYARDPVYSDDTGNAVALIVKFYEMADEVPFGATPFDTEPYGVELYYNAQAGMYGPIAPYVPPPPVAD
jgi:hypothetical protein